MRIFSETPVGARIAVVILLMGVLGALTGYIPIVNDSPIKRLIIYMVTLVIIIYLLLTSVWKRTIIIDKQKGTVILSESCPYLFQPKIINISELFAAGVSTEHVEDRKYHLVFKTKDGKYYSFGSGVHSNESKYKKWAKEINELIWG